MSGGCLGACVLCGRATAFIGVWLLSDKQARDQRLPKGTEILYCLCDGCDSRDSGEVEQEVEREIVRKEAERLAIQ